MEQRIARYGKHFLLLILLSVSGCASVGSSQWQEGVSYAPAASSPLPMGPSSPIS